MITAVIIGVHDGVVLAADSPSTLYSSARRCPVLGVLNVYDKDRAIRRNINKINTGFLLGGYSSGEPLVESWLIEVTNGVAGILVDLRKKDPALVGFQVLSRIAGESSPDTWPGVSGIPSGSNCFCSDANSGRH